MTSRQQWAVVGAVVLTLGLGLAAATYLLKDDLFPVEQGSAAPTFRAKPIGDAKFRSFADYKGKVLLLNIWATYCEPCKVEMPSLEKLYQQYGPNGLKIVAVEIDPNVTDDSIRTYAKNLGITFEILHDPTHEIERAYQVTGYPETFVIGPEGTIRKKWIGPDNWSSIGNRALVAQLLGLPTPRPTAEVGER